MKTSHLDGTGRVCWGKVMPGLNFSDRQGSGPEDQEGVL